MDCTTFLCEGILIEILSRLPAKSLIRFMAVCRLWKSIITSPQFSLVSKRPAKVLFHTTNQESYTLIEDDDEDNRILMFETESPLPPNDDYPHVFLGSDNGLLCFGIRPPVGMVFFGVTIWNPSIRKHVEVPANPFVQDQINHSDHCYGYGFGGTISGSDYKLVMFLGFIVDDCFKKAADIYSLKTGTWRRKHLDDDFCFQWCSFSVCALVEGRLHWIGGDEPRSYALNSYDLEDEVLVGNINVPEEVSIRPNYFITSVTVINESLALFASDEEGRQATVWVMEEYGDFNSWIKLCVIDQTNYNFRSQRIMVHLLKNGDLLLGLFRLSSKNLLVTCNPKTRKTSDFGVGFFSLSDLYGFTIHKESLVLLGDQYHGEVREVRKDLPTFEQQSLVQAQPLQGHHPHGFSLQDQYATDWQMSNPCFIHVGYFPAWTGAAGFYWYQLFQDQYGYYYYAWTGFHYCNPYLII